LLVAFLFQQRATSTSGAPAAAGVLTGASAQPQVTTSGPNRSRALPGVMLALVARRAQQPEADPQVLAALSSTVDGRYPNDWSEEERGRAVAQEVMPEFTHKKRR
jgi:hypothetical protein